MAGRKRSLSWDRTEVVRCHCSELPYTHVHCPCSSCSGKPVSTSVEYRHWQLQNSLQSEAFNGVSPVSTISEAETEEESVEEGHEIAQDSFASANVGDSNDDDDFLESSSGNGVSEGLHTDQQHEEQSSEEAELKIKREIVTVICKAMMLVNQMHGSFNDIEDVLTFAKDLFFRNDCDHSSLNYWPRNWRETEKLLKEFDYKGPKDYYICLDESHPCHWDLMDSPTSTCRHCGKPGSIKYYYLGLSDKIRTWFTDVSMCSKMLAHWMNRDEWINRAGSNSVLKEVWDGMRFSELAWFWNPDAEWMLPCRCKCCGIVISENKIRAFPERDGVYTVQCEECGTKEDYQAQFVRGEPRNIALIGHWDGWQPFGAPGQHSCGAIEVSIANMYKHERAATEEVYVVGFVPSHMLPKKRPNSLDPFLEPLVSEIENIFIEGYQVEYVGNFPELDLLPGFIDVRVLLLLWTGDYPAQSEIGKFINGGILACRRDKHKGTINPSGAGTTYYFGQNRFAARFPPEERKLENEVAKMKEISDEDRRTVRERLSRESGYTGLSILHRLYSLYGFDVIRDIVFDVMHNLPLNIVGCSLKRLIAEEKLDAKEADQRLENFPWTAELKDGRTPQGLSSRLGYWKTEEFQKFSYPVSELLLAGLLEPMEYHLWQLTARMTELIFNKRNGWSLDDVYLFQNLAKRYIILNEEHRGLAACRITVHNLQHIPDDALRFSHPDNFWCFSFERAVKRYVSISSNFKNMECSFAKRESYRELLKLMSTLIQPQEETTYKVDLEKMCAKSLEGARHIEKLVTSMPLLENSFKEGVFVGGMIFNEVQFSQRDTNLINLSDSSVSFAVPEIAFSFRSFWRPVQTPTGMLYRKGEHVVCQVGAHEYICQITNFLCLCSEGEFFKFVKVLKYSQAVDEEGTPLSDPYSGGLVINTANAQDLIVPVNAMSRKIILCSIFADGENADRKITVDFQRETPPISAQDILVPFYPQVNDMISIKGDEPIPWLAKVLTIQERTKTVKVWYYVEDMERPGEKLYVPYRDARQAQDWVSWDSILGLAIGEWRGDAWKME